ncbi:TetR/AcrR family transcriptional regulator [Rhodococcus sp. NCIMB 12038]|uniref:TetR/AcrR family transcriptional regulator n=1 Tax=Rhodococcus sp. NCIMB 12038 TaxID=933800 RepID=UPI000B3D1910|nr:TetR/AcrR family transcriptional regulator [Rhodococcus sp. NCIMB 12038]OUS79941.1 TetR family transcriptional regulator [Rhodococcus sp. NCIMB 12038]
MNDTKARILGTSSDLFRRNGYTGTGLKQVATEARAPFGSIYHFFPGGKQQLGEEVIRTSGEEYARLVFSILDAHPDILEGIEVGFRLAGETLVATDYADACPIATVALEVASTNEVLRVATADVFTSWIDSGSALLRARGFGEADARRLILGFVTSLEGAFVLARALRSTEPLDAAGATVLAAARACLSPRE